MKTENFALFIEELLAYLYENGNLIVCKYC